MSENLTLDYRPVPIGAALRHDWMGLDVPAAGDVRGIAWGRETAGERSVVTVCFTPRDPGIVLSPVAEYLHFSPLSGPQVVAPPSVVLVMRDARLELHAFGDSLWETEPLDLATLEMLGDRATVLIMDRPTNVQVSRFPRLPPSMIWAGRLPLQRGRGDG